MFKKMEHIGIMVNDMDRSIEFYTEVVGMDLKKREKLNEEVELAFLAFAGSEDIELELVGRGTTGLSDQGIVNHLAFSVEDIDETLAHLKAHGVRLLDQTPREILDGVWIAFFFGPDGERLELVQQQA